MGKPLMQKNANYLCWVLSPQNSGVYLGTSDSRLYSEGKDQKDNSSRPAWENRQQDPISKKPFMKKAWWTGSRCKP
jgi:hypothetical protein